MKSLLYLWHRLDKGLQVLEQWLIVLGMLTILGTGLASIALQNTVGFGLSFVDVLSCQLTVWLGLLGAMLATASAEHINIDALSRLLSERGLRANRVFIGLVSTLFSGVLVYCAFAFLWFYIKNPTQVDLGSLKVNGWYFVVIFPVAFVWMTVRYLVQTIAAIYDIIGDPLPWFESAHTHHHEQNDPQEELLFDAPVMIAPSSEPPLTDKQSKPSTAPNGGQKSKGGDA